MTNFKYSNQYILSKSNISHNDLNNVINQITKNNVDYADLYFQYSRNEFWSLEDGKVKNGSYSIDQGVGIRSVSDEKTAFTYSNDISLETLKNATQIVNSIRNQGQSRSIPNHKKSFTKNIYSNQDPIESLASMQKIKILETIEMYAKKLNPKIIKVSASLAAQYEVILIHNYYGHLIEDVRTLII